MALQDDQRDIYAPAYVRALFDEMARTYGIVNLISSLGFAARWRKQCVLRVSMRPGSAVVDLMTGMGELLPDLARKVGRAGFIRAIDISPEMCARAREQIDRHACPIEVIEGDALWCEAVESSSVDAVFSSFGLKTFSPVQIGQLAGQVARILKPGGQFSLLEISVPPNRWLRAPYLFYLNRMIPLIGRLFLGNPDNYRMLGVYTEAFGNCTTVAKAFRDVGLIAEKASYFFGCATGVHGHKPARDECTPHTAAR